MEKNFSHVNLTDGHTLKEEVAKSFATKSRSDVGNRIQTIQTVASEVPANASNVQKFLHETSEFIASVGDEFVMIFPYPETVSDFAKGRISGKQTLKNAAPVATGVALAATAVALFPVVGFIATFFIGFGGKKFFLNEYKSFFDSFYEGDNTELPETFEAELAEILRGKFLTVYDLEILCEAIGDAITKDTLKNMYQNGDSAAQKKWARDVINHWLQQVEEQRILVIMPTAEEWQAGLQRVEEMINSGEDINARMEQQRTESLNNRRKVLEGYNLKPYEIAQPVSGIINPMVRTQVEGLRTLGSMQQNEMSYQCLSQEEQTNLDGQIDNLIEQNKNSACELNRLAFDGAMLLASADKNAKEKAAQGFVGAAHKKYLQREQP